MPGLFQEFHLALIQCTHKTKTISIKHDIIRFRGGSMNSGKIIANVLYAVGIIGGMEGVSKASIPISVVALLVIIIASYLLDKN